MPPGNGVGRSGGSPDWVYRMRIRRTAGSLHLCLPRFARDGQFACVLIFAVLALVAGGCKPKMNAYAPPPPAEVTVAHPVRKSVTRYLEYTGTTEAYEAVELRARVAGFLDEVKFKPGAAVKKGDLLFVIDPRVYEAQARQAQSELAAKEAAERLSEITLKHVAEASKSQAVAQLEVDRAEADVEQAKAQVDLAKAELATRS